MKTAVVYYSMSGNCEYTAKKIAQVLDADLIRLEPQKAYPDSGARKFLWGGKSAVMGEAPALKPYKFDASAYDRIIFGFPVWAANPTPPIRTFIRDNKNGLSGKKFAAFACQSGNGAEKAFVKLAAAIGIPEVSPTLVLIDPKDRPKDTDAEKIEAFSAKLS